ncbi:MAG: ECF-type sigma factor [Planctomycetaceae bacterium]
MRKDQGSVTRLIFSLQEGDEYAAVKLWEHFYTRLVGTIRSRISGVARRVSDEDDVANDAFEQCFRGIRDGRYPDLRDRNSLWGLLLDVSEKRLINVNRDLTRQKRGSGNVRGESFFYHSDNPQRRGIEHVAGPEPTPEFAVSVAEQSARLLDCLDEIQRKIALLKLAGHTNHDISKELQISVSTVERKLSLIRSKWQSISDQDNTEE